MKMTSLTSLLCALMLLSSVSEGLRRFCPRGWVLFGGQCLTYVPSRMSWAEAEKNCLLMGGNLASVRSSEEYRMIQRFIFQVSHKAKRTWIGGSNAAQTSVWLWSDGTLMTYTKWCPNEPNNWGGKEKCMEMNHSGKLCWNDLNCNNRLPSICRKSFRS